MDFESPQAMENQLNWPEEFDPEEIKTLEEAAAVYNTMHNLDQMGMADTAKTLTENNEELLKKAQTICQNKGYRLETLIEDVQKEAEKKFEAN